MKQITLNTSKIPPTRLKLFIPHPQSLQEATMLLKLFFVQETCFQHQSIRHISNLGRVSSFKFSTIVTNKNSSREL